MNTNVICQNCKGNFIVDADDFAFYGKVGVPAPTSLPGLSAYRPDELDQQAISL